MVGQSGRHGWRIRPPPLGCTTAIGRLENQQGLAQTGVGQDKVVRGLEPRQLMLQAVFALAERGDPPSSRRYALPDVQVEPLHQGRMDLPAAGSQYLRARLARPATTRGLPSTRRQRR